MPKIRKRKNNLSKDTIKADEKWRTEHDLSVLRMAEEINKDKKRLTKVKRLAKQQIKQLKKI